MHIDIFPRSIAACNSCSPYPDPLTGNTQIKFNPLGFKMSRSLLSNCTFQSRTGPNHFIGGHFMDATGIVTAGIDSHHRSGKRNYYIFPIEGGKHRQPWMIESRIGYIKIFLCLMISCNSFASCGIWRTANLFFRSQ